MLTPLPTQLSGALFLANRKVALLADSPRVGKTGAAIIAADYILAKTILIVTTASGRAVWKRAVPEWSKFFRSVHVMTQGGTANSDTIIVSWPSVSDPKTRATLLARRWDLLILDESHFAKNPEAKRTQAVFGHDTHGVFVRGQALVSHADTVWCLTGTPIPNAPNDLWPMLRALAPERLGNLIEYQDFLHHYCVVKMKKLPRGFRRIPVVIAGKNLPELRERVSDFMLRRTQEDVGIRPPIYETFPLAFGARERKALEADVDKTAVLAAAEAGATKDLDMHLGKLRRVTGALKAPLLAQALHDDFASGLDKVVIMAWHHDTLDALREHLMEYGVVGIDGRSTPATRERALSLFTTDPRVRVFLGQITAAGEAIDLSAAAVLYFVESSFVPKDMQQAALRITNITQKRQAFVRVCVLEGSIDEALQSILLRKWTSIREVLAA